MSTEKEKMLAGKLYTANDPQLTKERRLAREFTRLYNATAETEEGRRQELLGKHFGMTGDMKVIEPPFRCDYGYNINIGNNFYANFDCVFLDVCQIQIGDNCLLGPGVHIYTATHPLDSEERLAGKESGKPVIIGDNVWIGGRSIINPGVKVGNHAVIASGSIVVKDVPSHTLVGGNPAKVIKHLNAHQ